MTAKARNGWIVGIIVIFPFALFLFFLISDVGTGPAPKPMPNPNGYDDLVRAGKMVSTNTWTWYDIATNKEQLSDLVAENAAALWTARSGLSNECRIPIYFTPKDMHLDDCMAIKRLPEAFLAEGKLAEVEGRPQDAAKSYLDIIHLANESSRGGRLFDGMIGNSIESIGTPRLQRIINRLDATSCREAAAQLENLDAQRPAWDDIMRQEQQWARKTFGLRIQLARQLGDLVHGRTLKEWRDEKHYEQRVKDYQKQTRQLILDLAARAYDLDKGKKPATAADLVPGYLKAVPQDPFTGTNLVYSP